MQHPPRVQQAFGAREHRYTSTRTCRSALTTSGPYLPLLALCFPLIQSGGRRVERVGDPNHIAGSHNDRRLNVQHPHRVYRIVPGWTNKGKVRATIRLRPPLALEEKYFQKRNGCRVNAGKCPCQNSYRISFPGWDVVAVAFKEAHDQFRASAYRSSVSFEIFSGALQKSFIA